MRLYHGSDADFKEFKICESLVRCDSTRENEGLGIYFSTDKRVASSYGRYLYTIDIPKSLITDFRKCGACIVLINNIGLALKEAYGFNIGQYIDTISLQEYIQSGSISIWEGVGREIALWLDSHEDWYESNIADPSDIEALINNYIHETYKAYMFKYNIKNVGVIKDVSLAKIVNKEET